jgi:hypothetical protein
VDEVSASADAESVDPAIAAGDPCPTRSGTIKIPLRYSTATNPVRTVTAWSRITIAVFFLSAAALAAAQSAERIPAMASDFEKRLPGVWRHSREEDTETESVYRPDSYDFPPARGRTGYEFRADHSCDYLGISPRDGSARQQCKWQLRGGTHPEIVVTFPDGREDVLPIVSLDTERLVVRKPAA